MISEDSEETFSQWVKSLLRGLLFLYCRISFAYVTLNSKTPAITDRINFQLPAKMISRFLQTLITRHTVGENIIGAPKR